VLQDTSRLDEDARSDAVAKGSKQIFDQSCQTFPGLTFTWSRSSGIWCTAGM
jgi:hypothetical protein